MPKVRSHNEWFRPVSTRSVYETRLTLPLADYQCSQCNYIDTHAVQNVEKGLKCCHTSIPYHQCGGDLVQLCPPFQREYQGYVGYESSRKSCPTCKAKLELDELVWSWGEYRNAKCRTVTHFCKACFDVNVKAPLLSHGTECGCEINLVSKGCTLPKWLTLESKCLAKIGEPS